MTEKIDFKCPVEVGFTFEKSLTLTEEEISTFAKLSDDLNPIHHEPERAIESRFGGLIASGPQTSALFMGSVPTYFAPEYFAMGMQFEVEFLAPVRPNLELIIKWVITEVIPKPRLNGYIIINKGGIYHNKEELVHGIGTCLILKE